MKNKIIHFFEFIGLDYKKELIKLCLINFVGFLLSVAVLILTKIFYLFILLMLVIIILDYYFYSKYISKRDEIISSREDEFVSVITYFQIFIFNKKNVYQSFSLLIPYCSTWMQERINELLSSIDSDKSVKPFIDFSSNFKTSLANNIMLSIYQMVDQGTSSEQIAQFIILFDQLSKAHLKQSIDKKERSLDNIGVFALIGAGSVVVLLMFGILSIMGDLLNVI